MIIWIEVANVTGENVSDIVTLTCPSCGGKLEITSDLDRFACGHCGNEHIVKRSGGTVSISPVVEGLSKVQEGVDKTASELAIKRLNNEIDEIEKEWVKTKPDEITPVLVFIGGLLIGGFFLYGLGELIGPGFGVTFLIIGVIGLLAYVLNMARTNRRSAKQKRDELMAKARKLQKEVDEQQKELERLKKDQP